MSALRRTNRAQDRERLDRIEECQDRGVPIARFAEPFHAAMGEVSSGELSDATGVSPARILHYSTERSDTIDAVMRCASALDILGYPEMLDEANRLAGRVTFRLPEIEGPLTANVMHALAEDAREYGEFASAIAASMRDAGPGGSRVTPEELATIEREGGEMIASIQRTLAAVRSAASRDADEEPARTSTTRSKR